MEQFFDLGAGIVRLTAADDIIDLSGANLMAFAVPPREPDLHLTMSLVPALPAPEGKLVYDSVERRIYETREGQISLLGEPGNPYMHIARQGRESHAVLRQSVMRGPIFSKLVLRAVEIEHLAHRSGSLLLHSSFIGYQGEAILFTAPCETGKSTQAELWRQHRGAQVLNGDRSVVRRYDGKFYARGVPFCGTSGICAPGKLPLKAVVVLSQAPENTIRPLGGLAAFRAIWEGCSFQTWHQESTARTAEILTDLIEQVPIYHLACTPDVRAVQLLEQQLY